METQRMRHESTKVHAGPHSKHTNHSDFQQNVDFIIDCRFFSSEHEERKGNNNSICMLLEDATVIVTYSL